MARNGYASDGGLFMPMSIPKLSDETLQSWKDLSYPDIVKQVARLFIEDEIPAEILNGKIFIQFGNVCLLHSAINEIFITLVLCLSNTCKRMT